MKNALLLLLTLVLTTVSNAMAPKRIAGPVTFPKDFKWCVATSAHQIEGGNSNSDWWDWESTPGHIKNGDRSGRAPDHWDHLEEDVGLLKDLHVGEYRFSVEWAKIEPQQGVWDMQVVEHYKTELALLRSAGVEPMVTLHHFTLPRWFAQLGGWESAQAPELFARYAAFVLNNIGPEVH
ncbi:MAG: glycoside hydrolase family 1 protein, partial [Deltaproteobacteria bacterium]|nr:glycoside hydrolase family 1 protein [Deltaproteobacteria bacterium]